MTFLLARQRRNAILTRMQSMIIVVLVVLRAASSISLQSCSKTDMCISALSCTDLEITSSNFCSGSEVVVPPTFKSFTPVGGRSNQSVALAQGAADNYTAAFQGGGLEKRAIYHVLLIS